MSETWTKQGHLEKCSNEKLPTSSWLMTEPSSTANFTSTLSNVNNVKISDLREFLVTLLFSTHCFHPKIIWKKLQDHEKIHGGDNLKKISSSSFFPFSPSTLKMFKVKNKKLDQIMSQLLAFSKWLTCILDTRSWLVEQFEYVLRYFFIIVNNDKLLVAF